MCSRPPPKQSSTSTSPSISTSTSATSSTSSTTPTSTLPPNLQPLASLIGTFHGTGKGVFPTIETFSYGERITLTPMGDKPILSYIQHTWNPETNVALHAESGYWRFLGPTSSRLVELVIAQPSGITEIDEGTYEIVDGYIVITTNSTSLGHTATTRTPHVTSIRRIFKFAVDPTATSESPAMTYTLDMATTTTTTLTNHLIATFHKQ